MTASAQAPLTVADAIRQAAAELDAAGVFFGHGTDNAVDEAAALVMHAAGIDHRDPNAMSSGLDAAARERLAAYLDRRIRAREPAAYITGEAWFCGLRFQADRRALIPRSPFAELIRKDFVPWRPAGPVRRVLEIGTGGGCIAIAAALRYPGSEVVATDLSADALELARANRRLHGLGARLHLVQADLLTGLAGQFDLIISNPPYVPVSELSELPPEYRHEPGLALLSGADGLESARRILQDAPPLLAPGGLLALEVGSGWPGLEAAFPRLPFVWPELEDGGEGIALLCASDFAAASRDTITLK